MQCTTAAAAAAAASDLGTVRSCDSCPVSSGSGERAASMVDKAAVWLVVIALAAAANGAFAGRVLEEQPAAAPAPAEAPVAPVDPLPAPTDPPADTVVAPAAVPAGGAAATGNAGVGAAGGGAGAGDHHQLTFFMHDILGGSQPSARIVTGVVASAAANGQLPFARPNDNIFPIQGAMPLPQGASNLVNGNNVPYVAGLGGTSSAAIVQGNGNGNGSNKNIPFVNAGDLPSGATLQNLLFGTTTVIDDELTEGHELGAAVVGRAQGFYVASSQDGTSKTLVLTAMFDGGGVEAHGDTLSFFGVHRMAAPESHVAVIGGTGKYENAKGFAVIQTLHPGDEHTTDGVETLLQFSIHLI
ncbi:dirigent protein 10-like [Oryza glaberrima]|nr:dirigent protein 10-like [Oryza glaberrima]